MNTDWLKWHAAELAAVTVPTSTAVVTHQWWLLAVTLVAGAQWVRHEVANRPQPCPVQTARRRETTELTA